MTTRGPLIRGACVVTALIAGSLVEACWAGDVTIKDGDTILIDGKTCRLDAIDAPELDQVCLDEHGGGVPCGREARERLAQFVGGRAVHCEDNGPDPAFRKRRICTCTVEGETMSINRWLVHEGLAINFEPFARGRFQSDEDDARQNRRGLWRGASLRPSTCATGGSSLRRCSAQRARTSPTRATSCSPTTPRCHRAVRSRASSQCAPRSLDIAASITSRAVAATAR
jgi:endonuclease YncB( thermonuclease family)